MRNKGLLWLAQVVVIAMTLSGGARAQNPLPVKLTGTINDYNPTNLGSYEMRGTWSLKLKGESGTADFSAALNMEHSDLALINGVTTRNAHTHHIRVTGGTVTPLNNGFRVTGGAVVTGNGNFPPPYPGANTVPVNLQIDITGGTTTNPGTVAFSNIQLTFLKNDDGSTSAAQNHFGMQAINGVVKSVTPEDDRGADKLRP